MTPRPSRREILLVALVVAMVTIGYRWAWTAPLWQEHLASASELWGIPVEDAGRWFSAWTVGDGQAYALIASDPLGLDIGAQLGQPAYRYARAGFGWLAWIASFGQRELVPYGLAAVGALSIFGCLMLAIRLRPSLGPSSWLIVLNPAVFIGFAGDTAETLAVLVLALGLTGGGSWWGALLGAVRPTYILALLSRVEAFFSGLAIALVMAALWMLRFGVDLGQFGGRIGFPLVGYVEAPSIHSIGLLVFALVSVVVGVRARNLAWIASGIFVVCFTVGVLEEAVNSWRAGGLLVTLWAFGPYHRVGTTASDVEGQWRRLFNRPTSPISSSHPHSTDPRKRPI